MPDARITIEGQIGSDPRYNTTNNGTPVANLRVLAGRSKKNDQGGWDTLSTTAYDVSFWSEYAQLVDSLKPEKGSKVIVSGTVTAVESYQGQQGESLSVKINGDGLRVFPKRDQQQSQGGFQQAQNAPQQGGWGQGPQQSQQDPWGGGGGGMASEDAPF